MTVKLKSGVYEIVNHQHKNHAGLTEDKVIRGDTFENQKDIVDRKLLWRVTLLGNGKRSIRNNKSTFYTVCDQPPRESCSIFAKATCLSQWAIVDTGNTGCYAIAPTNNPNLFWGLNDAELGTPILLRNAGSNPANWWSFRRWKAKRNKKLLYDEQILDCQPLAGTVMGATGILGAQNDAEV
ncbi:hypothetical protein BD410DRAFT_787392 [Rickenella mellea]|uniref:Ricin B lectin domain-containing protein n=1 Tax=Rickenella mellea TaxID=50990 RepID=A0A4Y7Q7Y5_9AGAM|nr:hypothetical protein BD410DRAFT_787392 [Rickenella mellea]